MRKLKKIEKKKIPKTNELKEKLQTESRQYRALARKGKSKVNNYRVMIDECPLGYLVLHILFCFSCLTVEMFKLYDDKEYKEFLELDKLKEEHPLINDNCYPKVKQAIRKVSKIYIDLAKEKNFKNNIHNPILVDGSDKLLKEVYKQIKNELNLNIRMKKFKKPITDMIMTVVYIETVQELFNSLEIKKKEKKTTERDNLQNFFGKNNLKNLKTIITKTLKLLVPFKYEVERVDTGRVETSFYYNEETKDFDYSYSTKIRV